MQKEKPKLIDIKWFTSRNHITGMKVGNGYNLKKK